jgi:hypothetical protein
MRQENSSDKNLAEMLDAEMKQNQHTKISLCERVCWKKIQEKICAIGKFAW